MRKETDFVKEPSTKGDTVDPTRRDFAKMAALALPAAGSTMKANSLFGGFQIGIIIYSSRG